MFNCLDCTRTPLGPEDALLYTTTKGLLRIVRVLGSLRGLACAVTLQGTQLLIISFLLRVTLVCFQVVLRVFPKVPMGEGRRVSFEPLYAQRGEKMGCQWICPLVIVIASFFTTCSDCRMVYPSEVFTRELPTSNRHTHHDQCKTGL